jgi:c-di-GMP-binding flagellar brake protein YcgR
MPVTERRRAPRIPVSVSMNQHVEGQSHRCVLSDLSLTGLYMERPIGSFVRHSAAVELEIPLPDGEHEPVWASGEIVYDCFDGTYHGTAVRFAEMSERDRARLCSFLAASPGRA